MRRYSVHIVVIIAAVLAMYPVLFNEFVHWDDPFTIFENTAMNPPTWRGVMFYFAHQAGGLYVPLTYAFWSALAAVSHTETPGPYGEHLNPFVFHAASIGLHIIAAILVLRILRQLKFGQIASFCGALIFATHPVQVEAVAWASGAKDLLCAVFSLLCIWQYLLFASEQNHRWIHYIAAMIALLVAMLCKPSALMVPAILFVLDRYFVGPSARSTPSPGTPGEGQTAHSKVAQRAGERSGPHPSPLPAYRASVRRTITSILPFIVLALPLMIIARMVQDTFAVPPVAVWARPLIAGDALSFYLGKLFFPCFLCVDYGRSPSIAMRMTWIKFAWLIPTAIAISLFLVRKKIPQAVAASLIFLLPLLPVLGFTAFMFQAHSTVADHYLYMPMLGIAIAVAAIIERWRRGWPVVVAIALVFGVMSNLQSRTWANSLTLFSQAIKVNPDNSPEQGNLGNALAERGDFADAIPHLRRAVEIDPKNRLPHLILAQVALTQNRYEDAIAEAHIAISVARPDEDVNKERLIARIAMTKLNSTSAPSQSITSQPITSPP